MSMVCKSIQKDFNEEEYPPLFQFDVVGNVRLRFAIQVESDVQITPVGSISVVGP